MLVLELRGRSKEKKVPTYMYESSFPMIRRSFPLGLVPDVSMIFFSRIHSGTLGASRTADVTSLELVDFLKIPASDS